MDRTVEFCKSKKKPNTKFENITEGLIYSMICDKKPSSFIDVYNNIKIHIEKNDDDFYDQKPITYESVLLNVQSMKDRGWIDLLSCSSPSVGVSSIV